ncbi:hypothetical protein CCYA_CCYA10G2792 [Cyanidiococcus yangmingshanensis]|nr:hypothetical protein CCYA_CCYA10G2792 [Cyanidiococcus yangmingshanensis]
MDLWFNQGSKSSCNSEFQGKRMPQVGERLQPASSGGSVLPRENRTIKNALNYVTPVSLHYWRRTCCDHRPQRDRTCATANWSRQSRLCRGSRATWRASLELPRDGTEARVRGVREETDAESDDSSASLLRFIESGPLAGVTPAPVSPSRLLSRWRAWGDFLFKELALDGTQETSRVRVYHFYLPIFAWCLDVVNRLQREPRRKHHGVIIGMQCPQGGGKTTLTTALQKLFTLERLECVSLSIDDFYLTRREQEALARAFPENPLLESRGNPGTHDISLALQTLDQLVTAPRTKEESTIAVPRYDKSAFQGRGDRASPESWQSYERPVDVVFLEGWCLGFRPLELHHRSVEMDPVSLRNLMQVDRFLAQDFCRLYPLLDAFIVIALDGPNLAESLQTVYQWRLEAEQQMRAAGRPAMTDEQVYAFVDKFMPAYRAYLSDLYWSPPLTGDASRELRVGIDRTRAPTRRFPWS